MMGFWFPGRTLLTVLPLSVLPIALLIERLPRRLRIGAAALAIYSVAVTGALMLAARAGEVVLAVDPFEMGSPLFRLPALLFPDYRTWGAETVVLTVAWLALAAIGLAAVAWREYGDKLRALRLHRGRRAAVASPAAEA
jgi:hypothetical protein